MTQLLPTFQQKFLPLENVPSFLVLEHPETKCQELGGKISGDIRFEVTEGEVVDFQVRDLGLSSRLYLCVFCSIMKYQRLGTL
jgi:hypothetical protein